MRKGKRWAVLMLGMCTSALAGRPLTIDDAEPVDTGKFQLQAGELYVGEGSSEHHWDTPVSLSYGLVPHLEIGAGTGWQFDRREAVVGEVENHNGIDDLVFETKWKFLDQEKAFADQAITAAIKVPIANEDAGLGSGAFDYSLTYLAIRQISDKLSVSANVGYTWVGDKASV